MNIPQLKPSTRHREYDKYSDEIRAQVIRAWLFSDRTHRQLDEEILGLDRNASRGFQSMGILHFLGLKKSFHGIFQGTPESEAIGILRANSQEFGIIIAFLENTESVINLKTLIDDENKRIEKSKKDTSTTRYERIADADKKPKRQRVYTYVYRRNPDVVVETLNRAGGVCEDCNDPAPFQRASNGTPFLEVHHIKSLSDGGEDTLENVVALCPNCHRKRHHG